MRQPDAQCTSPILVRLATSVYKPLSILRHDEYDAEIHIWIVVSEIRSSEQRLEEISFYAVFYTGACAAFVTGGQVLRAVAFCSLEVMVGRGLPSHLQGTVLVWRLVMGQGLPGGRTELDLVHQYMCIETSYTNDSNNDIDSS